MKGFDLERYVEDRIGVNHRTEGENGTELVCDCPECGKRSRLWVNVRQHNWICYYCFDPNKPHQGCGGDAGLVSMVEGISFKEALHTVGVRGQRSLADRHKVTAKKVESTDRVALPEGASALGPGQTLKYLEHRRVSRETAALYRLHYCLEGKYANRVILPSYVDGELVTFQARHIDDEVRPKYLTPSGGKKSKALFGYDQAIGSEIVCVVEGPFDVLGLARIGLSAVAVMGKTVSRTQTNLVRKMGARYVVVFLDPEAEEEAKGIFRELSGFVDVRFATLPSSHDPGDATDDLLWDALERASVGD